jgi:hypothetical protein
MIPLRNERSRDGSNVASRINTWNIVGHTTDVLPARHQVFDREDAVVVPQPLDSTAFVLVIGSATTSSKDSGTSVPWYRSGQNVAESAARRGSWYVSWWWSSRGVTGTFVVPSVQQFAIGFRGRSD